MFFGNFRKVGNFRFPWAIAFFVSRCFLKKLPATQDKIPFHVGTVETERELAGLCVGDGYASLLDGGNLFSAELKYAKCVFFINEMQKPIKLLHTFAAFGSSPEGGCGLFLQSRPGSFSSRRSMSDSSDCSVVRLLSMPSLEIALKMKYERRR